jgi:hypothetical protein
MDPYQQLQGKPYGGYSPDPAYAEMDVSDINPAARWRVVHVGTDPIRSLRRIWHPALSRYGRETNDYTSRVTRRYLRPSCRRYFRSWC